MGKELSAEARFQLAKLLAKTIPAIEAKEKQQQSNKGA